MKGDQGQFLRGAHKAELCRIIGKKRERRAIQAAATAGVEAWNHDPVIGRGVWSLILFLGQWEKRWLAFGVGTCAIFTGQLRRVT